MSPLPEISLKSPRPGNAKLRAGFSRSTAAVGLVMGMAGGVPMIVYSALFKTPSWSASLVASANLFACLVSFSLLLELCRWRFPRRSLSCLLVGLPLLCLLPFLPGIVSSFVSFNRWSLLAPGVMALTAPSGQETAFLIAPTALHLAITTLLFLAWRKKGFRSPARTAPGNFTSRPGTPGRIS